MRFLNLFVLLFSLSFSVFAMEKELLDLEKRVNLEIQHKSLSPDSKLNDLQALTMELMDYASPFHQAIIKDIENGKPLHGQQLTILHKVVSVYVSLSYQLEKLKTSSIAHSETSTLSSLEQIQLFYRTYAPYYINKKFRRLVNAEDSSYDIARKELKRQIRRILSKRNLKSITRSLEINSNTKIQSHPAFLLVKEEKRLKDLRRKLFSRNIGDIFSRTIQLGTHHLSGLLGNSAGAVRWRKGHLYNKANVLKEIYSNLQPLDIITEKTRFALTDTLIPGHFGHNAIWLGTKEQLKNIGMWNHPSILPIQKQIEEGLSIIETDRSGTHLKSLEVFMNVDEFGLLRLNGGAFTEERMTEIYKVAIAQLGKTYDFNFDVETTDVLVCSELLYQSFGDINWPTEDYLGRTTISPDNVTSLALYQDTPFELIYYISGEKDKIISKNLDDLASDIGFSKINGVYKEPIKICHYENKKRPGTTGSNQKIRVKKCRTEYRDLIYKPHQRIQDFN